MKGFFVTGTDTGVGKTWISAALLHSFNSRNLQTVAMKPVASGCQLTADGLRNDDALLLQDTASVALAYDEVNPYAFAPAIAPHLAAAQANVDIDTGRIKQQFNDVAAKADVIIVEGVGGWHVPINARQSMIDVARLLDLPVIVVVGMRLGCLNHALLTVSAIHQAGLPIAGWVANSIEAGMPCLHDNIDTLQRRIHAPLLGHIPFQSGLRVDVISELLSLP